MESNEQHLYHQKELTREKTHSQVKKAENCCPNCGTPYQPGDNFCCECGKPLSTNKCPNCGAKVEGHWEICPVCGTSLLTDKCSFCGAEMDSNDAFCPECGNSRKGIICPECGTLNFRSFCRKCNHPLNDMAKNELIKAQNDPIYKEMVQLAQQMAVLEEQIINNSSLSSSEDNDDESATSKMSDSDKLLVQQYKELLASIGTPVLEKETRTNSEQKSNSSSPRAKVQLTKVDLPEINQAKNEYKQKLIQMQDLMDKLIPPGDMTPQMQRNYYSARKLPVIRKEVKEEPVCWICNYCHCRHSQPNECAEPKLGGKWEYHSVLVDVKKYEYEE